MNEFDHEIDRRSVPGDKWGRYANQDILPLWVADMDFAAAPVILQTLRQRLEHGVLGYANAWPQLDETIQHAIYKDYNWHIEPDWLVWLPGVIPGFNLACQIAGEPGDEILTSIPVYPPFLAAPANTGRILKTVAMQSDSNGVWQWMRQETEAAINAHTKMLLLCSPHNPTGRVFSTEELQWIAGLAEKNNLIICSDEIHCGIVYPDAPAHKPIASLDATIAARTITLMAPSKTWNIAGLCCAFAIIPDAKLRQKYRQAMLGKVTMPNILGLTATEVAYSQGEPWRHAVIHYLQQNRDRVYDLMKTAKDITVTRPQATYLSWIDCRHLGLDDPAGFFEQHGVGLSDGKPFGMPGFVRLNFGCTRKLLETALERLSNSLKSR